MSFSIRKFEKQDAIEAVKLNLKVWRKAYSHIFPVEVFDERDKQLNERAEKLVNSPRNDEMYVAEIDGKIVATMYMTFESKIDFFKDRKFGELTVLYVDNDCQAQGIGRKLFELCKERLKSKNIKNFAIGVLEQNHIGRKAYERYGGVLSVYKGSFVVNDIPYSEVYYEYEV